ncbi:uncharacterized protein VTP21DRAFT_11037 [Calcarisporiella thermophila]|uniref:uncharacterized protein n=1 Tax=Calcarisporiella thermophila TaxID=911321 RepID=UPI003742F402
MTFIHFMSKNKPLIPLFMAVGAGLVGGVAFMGYNLAYNPDVILDKTGDRQPWNRIKQHQNSKLLTINKEFFENRRDMPDKRF